MDMYNISKCQKVFIPQGTVYLGSSDQKRSVGYLELRPHTSLTLHNRPVIERLVQVENKCEMVIFWDDRKVITLNEHDGLVIKPAGTYHIHVNPFNKPSLTYWDFEGDVQEIIKCIRGQAAE